MMLGVMGYKWHCSSGWPVRLPLTSKRLQATPGVQVSDQADIGDPVRPTDGPGLRTAEDNPTPIEGSQGARTEGRCFSVLDGGPPSPCEF